MENGNIIAATRESQQVSFKAIKNLYNYSPLRILIKRIMKTLSELKTIIVSKKTKIIYWISTLWLALGMLSSGIVQLFQVKMEVDFITHLGYPVYFLTILGIWKILGVAALLAPKFPLLKEWAYAGFFFVMSGAAFSHIVIGDSTNEMVPSLLLLTLTVISWYCRPANRKIIV